jgi:hypothetical protein
MREDQWIIGHDPLVIPGDFKYTYTASEPEAAVPAAGPKKGKKQPKK